MAWSDCTDIKVTDDDGQVLYEGPRYLRCVYGECSSVVTHGQIAKNGGCRCGGRKFRAAVLLTKTEQVQLMTGHYPLTDWETEYIGNNEI